MDVVRTAIFNTECLRCGRDFQVGFGNLPVSRSWFAKRIPEWCQVCLPFYSQERQRVHMEELTKALAAMRFKVIVNGERLELSDLTTVLRQPMDNVQQFLVKEGMTVEPADWWHLHYSTVIKKLQKKKWSSVSEASVLYFTIRERLSRWEWLDELPLAAPFELLKDGDAGPAIRALTRSSTSSRVQTLVSKFATRILTSPSPRIRFGALYTLVVLHPKSSAKRFLAIAADLTEHPRIRGAALQGISEGFHLMPRSQKKASIVLLEKLISDELAEVRWWATYAAGRLSGPRYDQEGKIVCNDQKILMSALQSVVNDPSPGGLGWAVGKEAQDALDIWNGVEPPLRPMELPFDPWGVI